MGELVVGDSGWLKFVWSFTLWLRFFVRDERGVQYVCSKEEVIMEGGILFECKDCWVFLMKNGGVLM